MNGGTYRNRVLFIKKDTYQHYEELDHLGPYKMSSFVLKFTIYVQVDILDFLFLEENAAQKTEMHLKKKKEKNN